VAEAERLLNENKNLLSYIQQHGSMPRGVREKQVGGAKLLVNDAEERLERVNKKKESFLADSKDQEIQAEEIASVGDVESSIEQFEVTPDNNTKRFLSIVLLLKLISDSGKYNKTTTKGNDKLDNKLITILLKATQNSGGKNNGDNNKDSVNNNKMKAKLITILLKATRNLGGKNNGDNNKDSVNNDKMKAKLITILLKATQNSGGKNNGDNNKDSVNNDKMKAKLITILLKATRNLGGKNNGDNNKDSVNIVKIFIILKYLLGFESLDVKYKKIVLEKLKKMLEDLGVENVLLQRINNKPIDDAIEFCKRLLKNLKR